MFSVTWIFVSLILINFAISYVSNKYINHGTLVDSILNIAPALTLILIAFPSFKLLSLMVHADEPIGLGRYLIKAMYIFIILWLYSSWYSIKYVKI